MVICFVRLILPLAPTETCSIASANLSRLSMLEKHLMLLRHIREGLELEILLNLSILQLTTAKGTNIICHEFMKKYVISLSSFVDMSHHSKMCP